MLLYNITLLPASVKSPMPSECESILDLRAGYVSVADEAQDSGERWQWADRIGAGLSLSCALHCLMLPLAVALVPSVRSAVAEYGHADGWLQWLLWSHQVEWAVALAVIAFAGVVIGRGWRHHRRRDPLGWYLAGSLVLLFAAAEVISLGAYHGLLLAGGGALIAMAHWRNLRASLGR